MKVYLVDDYTLKRFKDTLLKKKTEIEHLSRVTMKERKPVKLDQTMTGRLTRLDAIQLQSIQLETERRRNQELIKINVALNKIKSKSFGVCVICQMGIGLKRLSNNPTIPTCIDCAQN